MVKKHRKTHRKGNHKGTRRARRSMSGGQGSNVGNTSMNLPYKVNTLQGQEYLSQHGGVANVGYTGVLPNELRHEARVNQAGGVADVGYSGMLDAGLRESARLNTLDNSYNEIVGMKDQGGGGRRRKSRKNGRKASRKASRKNGRKSRKSRRCWSGGSSPVDAPTLLLPVAMEKQAVLGMNPEWKLAENPTSFDPLK